MFGKAHLAKLSVSAVVDVAATATRTRNATAGVASVCGSCCTLYSYAVPLGDGWALNVVGTVGAGVSLILVILLLARMSWFFRESSTRGYGYMATPVTAIRERRDGTPEPCWVLPWYYGYTISVSLFLCLQVFLSLPTGGPVIMWMNRLVCGLCECFDDVLIIYLCLPRITRFSSSMSLVVAAFVGCCVIGFVIATHDDYDLSWLTYNYPTTSLAYVYAAEGIICLIIGIWALWRPFAVINPRPAAAIVCLFWVPIYLLCSGALIPMEALWKAGEPFDFGYCMLTAVDLYYSLFFVPVLYAAIVVDSKFVLANHLHESLPGAVDKSAEKGADAEYLLRENIINEELVELMGDAAISIIPAAELTLLRLVGAGGYGQVWHASWNGTAVAVKKLLGLDNSNSDSDRTQLREFASEVRLLARLRHPNCLLLIGMVLERDNLALVSEFCSKGSLWAALRRHEPLSWAAKLSICLQTASAMEYLHQQRILHRDLKSPNVLLTEALAVRVADFGLSRLRITSSRGTMTGYGTAAWSAPEVLRQSKSSFPFAGDVWSFGVVVWELLTEQEPYHGLLPVQIGVGVLQQELALDLNAVLPGAPPALVDIVRATQQYEPQFRPSFAELREQLETQSSTV